MKLIPHFPDNNGNSQTTKHKQEQSKLNELSPAFQRKNVREGENAERRLICSDVQYWHFY